MPGGALARAESGSWARLHPLSPVVRFGRAAAGVVVLLGSNALVGENNNGRRITDLVILAVGLVASITSWAVTRWRLLGTDLQIETGLFRRQSLRLPLTRVQAIDIVRPVLARVLGLAEVRVVVAGGGAGKGRLAYLPEGQAEQLRAQLLAVAHGMHVSTPEPAERPLFAVDNGRLVGSVLLGTPALSFVVLLLSLGAVAVVAGPTAAAGVAGSLVTIGLALGAAIARRFNAEFSQTVGEAPDGLRLRGGLLQTRSETVPFRRLQAMRWVEPALWRPLGWCRLEIDVARQRNRRNAGDDSDNGAVARALMPVGSSSSGAALLHGFMPGVSADSAWTRSTIPPGRARWKAPLSRRHLGLWVDERVVVIGGGRLGRTAVVIPLHKAQSFRLVQGPYARLLGLASVHVDLVGRRWRPAAHCRDAEEARRLIDTLTVLARAARAREAALPRLR